MGFGLIGPTPYSRESTPDSGGSHYIDNFRDPSGEQTESPLFTSCTISQLCVSLQKLATVLIPLTEWWFNLITQTLTLATGLMLINVADLTEALWAQVFIPFHLYLARILRRRHRAMQCHPRNICRRMTNCSQRTGECLGEQEIKLFISRKPFS